MVWRKKFAFPMTSGFFEVPEKVKSSNLRMLNINSIERGVHAIQDCITIGKIPKIRKCESFGQQIRQEIPESRRQAESRVFRLFDNPLESLNDSLNEGKDAGIGAGRPTP